jgi:hypothetical protein
MNKIAILEAEYLETVNAFYAFWKSHIYDYHKHFKHYLTDGELKKRLSFNLSERKWYLIEPQEVVP